MRCSRSLPGHQTYVPGSAGLVYQGGYKPTPASTQLRGIIISLGLVCEETYWLPNKQRVVVSSFPRVTKMCSSG